jgi:hypothetical protein
VAERTRLGLVIALLVCGCRKEPSLPDFEPETFAASKPVSGEPVTFQLTGSGISFFEVRQGKQVLALAVNPCTAQNSVCSTGGAIDWRETVTAVSDEPLSAVVRGFRSGDVQHFDSAASSGAPGPVGTGGGTGTGGGAGSALCSVDLTPTVAVTIQFVNTSSRTLEVRWVDRSCIETTYNAAVTPGQEFQQPTYPGHLWRAYDANTRELVLEYRATADLQQRVSVP